MKCKSYSVPNPVISPKERRELDKLENRYKILTKPTISSKIFTKVKQSVPQDISKHVESMKDEFANITTTITEAELYKQLMECLSNSLNDIISHVSQYTINEDDVLKDIRNNHPNYTVDNLDELCMMRSYQLSKLVNKQRLKIKGYTIVQGAGTGFWGLKGLPANLIAFTFLQIKAIHTIAMYYGYNVKDDPSELVIANEVFINALNIKNLDSKNNNTQIGNTIYKIITLSQKDIIKSACKQTWAKMAAEGGTCLLITNLRALSNAYAKKALADAGKHNLEHIMFKETFKRIGKLLSLKNTGKIVPFVSAAITAFIDYNSIIPILEYADIFYHKRFLADKEIRIQELVNEKGLDN